MDAHQAYLTLELEKGASMEAIKSAYRRLALESHPDKSGRDGEKFKRVTEAYNILKGRRDPAPSPGRKSGPKRPEQRPQWGPPPGRGPEEDWGRFTREYEEGDPEWWKEYERKFWQDYEKTVNADGRNGEFDKTEEPPRQPDLDVGVDPSLCIGCCSCEIIAPEVFQIDRKTQTNPKSRVKDPRGAGVNRIMNAAETCPTRAIHVQDAGTGERMYPH